MPIKVSVVIPVYDPGPSTHDCVQALLGQTMPRADFELLLVRSGSSAGSAGSATWLDALARSHPHVRVVALDRTASRGELCNAGLDAAAGEYVRVAEVQERPAPEALRQMHDLGQRGRADIVLGKVASPDRQTLPASMRRARDDVPASDVGVWESLTPFALYRKAFLDQLHIRFPDDDRPLAREGVTLRALLFAKLISVRADTVCCYEVPTRTRSTTGETWAAADPGRYHEDLRRLVEEVERSTEPGDIRNVALRRLYRVELLGNLREPHLSGWSRQVRDALFAEAHKLANERVFDPVHTGLSLLERLQSTLVREGRMDDLMELVRRREAIQATARVTHAEWKNARLHVTLTAHLRQPYAHGSGSQPNGSQEQADGPGPEAGPSDSPPHSGSAQERVPVGLMRRAGHDFADPALVHGLIDDERAEVTKELRRYHAEVLIAHRTTGARWTVPAKLELVVEHTESDRNGTWCRLSFRGTVSFDPDRLAGRRPPEAGAWDVRLRIDALGVGRETGLNASATEAADLLPAVMGKPARVLVPAVTDDGTLVLDVDRTATTLASAMARQRVVPQPGNGRRLEVTMPALSRPGTSPLDVAVALRGTDEHSSVVVLPARLAPYGSSLRLVVDVHRHAPGPVQGVRAGTWQLWGQLDGEHGPEIDLGSVQVDPRSRAYLVGADRIGPLADLSRRLLAAAVSRPSLRRLGAHVVDWLPEQWQRRIRNAVRRSRR